MSAARFALAAGFVLALAGPAAAAEEHSGFVVTLGRDTTSVERVTRSATRLEVDQVTRAPRVLSRKYVYELDAKGLIQKFTIRVTAPGAAPDAPPVQEITGQRTRDSVITEVRGGANVRTVRAAVPADGVIVSASSPFPTYEQAMMRFAKSKRDSLRTTMYFIGAGNADWIVLRREGKDSMEVATYHEDVFRMRADREGRLLGARPIAGTGKYAAARVTTIDLEGITFGWAAAEKASGAMGQLSTRDTVKAGAGGAALWIDYGRPAKRGRVVYGGVVPYGEVWRTGANAATQFRTDRALDFGGQVLQPGMYTLWTLPTASGWKLVVNSETGQWGTEHKPDKDLFSVPMEVSSLPEVVERFTIGVEPSADGGELRLDWDTTRAAVKFKVAPAPAN